MSCSMTTSIIRGMLSCSMITPNLSIIEAVLSCSMTTPNLSIIRGMLCLVL